ncbi:MAG: ScpA family protein [Methanosarcinales archaeon Met12]|nr:MAG: ScpA family protein [Methanosarcinales archaeon Met12]
MEEPVEILVDLAKSGEIDPWNIDIVDVTDRFLKKLEDREQLDLWVSGRTLLYASILLRMKSEALVEDEDEVEEEEFFNFLPDYSQTEEYPVLRPNVRRQSKRPVTLLELIDELKNAIDRREQSRVRGIRREQNRPTTEDALQVVNQENLENQIQMVMEKLKKRFKKQKRISFSELVEEKNPSSIVQTYIPLLFLAIRKKIRLEQKELFGDIYIKSRSKSA